MDRTTASCAASRKDMMERKQKEVGVEERLAEFERALRNAGPQAEAVYVTI